MLLTPLVTMNNALMSSMCTKCLNKYLFSMLLGKDLGVDLLCHVPVVYLT